jgi:hypothetical protein
LAAELMELCIVMSRSIILALIATLVAAGGLTPSHADPLKPTVMEVKSMVDVLRFRSSMLADPEKTIATFAAEAARGPFATIDKQMADAGSGGAGWRLLLGTSVFSGAGLEQPRTLVVFYNPFVDTAVFTVWEARQEGRRIVDVDWVPGDLVRQANAEFDPRPLWLRGKGYRPDTLAQSVVTTMKAIESRFGDAKRIDAWRETLGIQDGSTYNKLITPILAMTLYETQLRLKALAVPAVGEDARLAPLRKAAAALITTASTEGFAELLAEANDTTVSAKQALAKINPKTMVGLAPVAYVVGEGHATVFFASTVTADYALSARFAERVSGYALKQLEFLPYAAVYQVAAGQTATSVPAATPSPVQSKSRGDPIGSVTKVSSFDRARRINIGKSSQGKPVCFFREEGGSHMLDIGVSAEGAFIRVAHGDGPLPAGEIPRPPLHLFAGKGLTKVIDGDEKYTGEYASLQSYGGSIDFVPNITTDFGDGFVVVSKDDAKSFFETIARARKEFVVIQSVSEPAKLDRVAIYEFTTNSIPALLSCAKKHIQ